MLNYSCLVLDHDDTLVNSTAVIHYPAFRETLDRIRPGLELSLEDYLRYNFAPGFTALCRDILHFTPEEERMQGENWLRRVAERVPAVYPGFPQLLARFKAEGGRVCVVSHSVRANILRDYRENGLPEPDLVFGWDVPPEHRKPSPWPLEEIMRQFSLPPEALLMVDDLKPGKDMADACGVDFAAVGWAYSIPEIADYMRAHARHYCASVAELEGLLFG